MEINSLQVGDIVELKKPHPSQTKEWLVIKTKPIVKLKSKQYPHLLIELKKDKAIMAIKTIKKPQDY